MKSNKTEIKNFLFIFILLSSLLPNLKAQTITVNDVLDTESSFSPEELIENVLVSGNCANISNITSLVNGDPTDLTTKSYGYFKRLPGSTFPFEEGIILTTGIALSTSNGPSDLSNPSTGVSDFDLNQIIDPNTAFTDATVFEFDFTPSSDTINFRYLMASEEYESNYPCLYSDSFAFLLKVAGTADYENIAIIPETTTPVSVTSVHPGVDLNGNGIGCGPQNEDYFEGYNLGDTNFNGRTTILNATATVIPNKKYHIKLVIADANNGQIGSSVDSLFDSAVFLEAGSFNLGFDLGDDFLLANNTAICGNELNLTANIAATSYQWLKDGVIIPGATNQTYTANLGDGTYSCNITDNNGCTGNDEVVLEFVTAPLVNPLISVFQICDIDGDLSENFNLTFKETEILDGNQIPQNFEVQYFSDTNYINQILDPAAYVNTDPFETIYVRVLNKDSSTCYVDGSFNIQITNLPIPTQPTDYQICDDTASGSDTDGKSSFLLNTKDAEILTDVTNPGEYTISYHTDILDAQTSSTTNAIDKDADYQITTSQTVYVRIENNNDPTLCYTVSDDSASSTFKSFELIVDPLPVVNTGVEINYCIVTGDPNPTVDLTQAENQISSTTNASFEYFKDLAGTDLILDPVSYPPVGNVLQSVYVKVISDQGCARDLVELVLNIGETPNNSFDDLVAIECDDFLDQDGNDTPAMNDDTDNITNFSLDLTAIIAAINPPINTEVFFYESTSDRNSNSNNIPDLTNYRNNPTNIDITVVPDGIRFPIYYKILSTINNDCEGIGQFYLQINQVPTVNPYGDLILCDDGDDGDFVNGIVQTFDLESQTPIILGTQDPLNFTVSYHLTDLDALSGASPIMNTSMYENITPNLQTIYVRVTNNTTGCFTNHTSFDLIVNPLPIANFVDDLEICDDNTDGSAQNGFSQSFDLELQTAGILGTQDPTQFSVTYHASLADAQAGTLPLGSPFSNSVPFSQIIYARVYNSLTGCANGISNFNAIVNPEPTTENASNLSYCDDDSDGDDTNGFVQNIDLDSQITDILGPLQDPDDFNVTFHETQTDATDGTDALSSPYTNTTANQQTIYVRVENKDTGCVNDDFTFDVIVNPLPKFKVTSPQIVCLSGPPLTLFIENPDAVYDYVWTAPNGDEFPGVEEITITSGGLYTVTATTTNGTDCSRTREIQVNESIVATITEADVTIVDDSDNNSITIDPTNLGIGDYQYALINENGLQTAFQDIPVFENLSGGFYTIVVQDKNGCRPDANLIVSVIEYPKFFTPNNDGINDTWAIKGANSTFYPSAQINIFNRFGKIVAQIDVDNPGWDGTYG
ncbi:choice-of-anchor L domain-containing protein, partial [Flavobacteriaceae bacterium]|nr:choice-of-anchor L domain-containing protein [Flavobacteriaceae bacterium]